MHTLFSIEYTRQILTQLSDLRDNREACNGDRRVSLEGLLKELV